MPYKSSHNTNSVASFVGIVFALAVTHLKVRYKNSILGVLWSMLNPLLYFIIFSFVFRSAFPDIENYAVYLLSGLIFWTFFLSGTNHIITSIVNYRGVLKSINVPAIAFALAALVSAILNLLLTLIPFGLIMFYFGFMPTWHVILLIPILLIFFTFTFGISLFLCSLNIFFRDIQHLWTAIAPLIFYSTPIFYSSKLIPEQYQWVLKFNPMYYFITMIRQVLYHGTSPDLDLVLASSAIALVSIFLGLMVYRKLEPGFISNY